MPPGFHRRRHDAFPKDVRTDHLAPPPNRAICLRHRCKRRASVTASARRSSLRGPAAPHRHCFMPCYEVSPAGERPSSKLTLAPTGGRHGQPGQAAVRSGSPVARCECFAGLSHPYRPTVVIASGRTRRSRSETKLPLVRNCPQSEAPALHWDDRWAAGRDGERLETTDRQNRAGTTAGGPGRSHPSCLGALDRGLWLAQRHRQRRKRFATTPPP